jgi:hypothetical protein
VSTYSFVDMIVIDASTVIKMGLPRAYPLTPQNQGELWFGTCLAA